MFYERTKKPLFSLDGAAVTSGDSCQGINIKEWPICQRVHFQIGPDVLHRVEFGSIGRKKGDVQIGGCVDEGSHLPGPVGGQAVPDQYNRLTQFPEEVAKKLDHQRSIDIGVRMQPKIQPNSIATRIDAESGNGGDFLVSSGPLVQHRRMPARVPAAANQGRHQQAGFVEENEVRFQSAGFFLMRGHSCFIHRWMHTSSRSIARRVGFWGLHPRERSSRPI